MNLLKPRISSHHALMKQKDFLANLVVVSTTLCRKLLVMAFQRYHGLESQQMHLCLELNRFHLFQMLLAVLQKYCNVHTRYKVNACKNCTQKRIMA